MASLTPLKHLKVSKHQIPPYKLIPNTSIINKPLLHYQSAFSSPSASHIEQHLRKTGVVEPQWRYTMYTTTHFHSITHEVLCISSGAARLCFGHESNPDRVDLEVRAGDVVVVPAGVGHRLLEEVESPFEMVGSYPKGKYWDMCYGREGEEEKVKGIERVNWFDKDPVYGQEGPALDV